MATAANNGQTLGGYELDFVGEIPPGCECAICQLPMKDPLIIESCGHRFCNVCLQPVLRQKPALCPLDRQPIPKDKVILDMEWKTKITSLTVLCPNKGCEWVGELAKLESHEREKCAFPQVCPFAGCKMRLNYATYSFHLKSCDWRTINCNNCKQDFSLCQLREHTTFCRPGSRTMITCVCGRVFSSREQMAQHDMAGCPVRRSIPVLNVVGVIPCPFAIFGCPARIRPCDISSHYISFVTLHLWFIANTVGKTQVVLDTTRKQTEYAATTLGFLREELQNNAKETEELKESSQTQAREIQQLKAQLNSTNNTVEYQDSVVIDIEENPSVAKMDKGKQFVMQTLAQDVKETQDKIQTINEAIADLQAASSVNEQNNFSWRQMNDRMTAKVEVQQQYVEKMKDQIAALQRQVLQFEKSRPHMVNQISALQQQALQCEKSGPHSVHEDCGKKIESHTKCCSETRSKLETAIEGLREELGVFSTRFYEIESKFLDHEENAFCWHKQTKELLRSRNNESFKLIQGIQIELKELTAVKDEHGKNIQQCALIHEKLTSACREKDEQVELIQKNINEIADMLGLHKESTRAKQGIEICETTTTNLDGKGKASRKRLRQNQLMIEMHQEIDALKNELKSVRDDFEVYLSNNSENNLFFNEKMQKQKDVLSVLRNQQLDAVKKEDSQQEGRLENCEYHFRDETTLNQGDETEQQIIGFTNAYQPLQGECNGHAIEQETFVDNVSLDVSATKQTCKGDFAKHLEEIERAVAALELTGNGPNNKDRMDSHSEDHTTSFGTAKNTTKLKHRE